MRTAGRFGGRGLRRCGGPWDDGYRADTIRRGLLDATADGDATIAEIATRFSERLKDIVVFIGVYENIRDNFRLAIDHITVE